MKRNTFLKTATIAIGALFLPKHTPASIRMIDDNTRRIWKKSDIYPGMFIIRCDSSATDQGLFVKQLVCNMDTIEKSRYYTNIVIGGAIFETIEGKYFQNGDRLAEYFNDSKYGYRYATEEEIESCIKLCQEFSVQFKGTMK